MIIRRRLRALNLSTMRILIFVLILDSQEMLAVAFSACLILWAVWRAYRSFIKFEREAGIRRAEEFREKMHREHWKRLRKQEGNKPHVP